MGTINTLGHSHTKPGGNAKGDWAQAPLRTIMLITVLLRWRLGIVGLQEFQGLQEKIFRRNSRASVYQYHGYADNAIIWLRLRFHVIDEGFILVPYFHGTPKKMPWVVLRKRAARKRNRKVFGFLCTHNPAGTRDPKEKAQEYRDAGWRAEVRLHRELVEKHGIAAMFSVGDKNDREYGKFVRRTGGEFSHVPSIRGIDWIAGWEAEDLEFVNTATYRDGLVERMTDHPLVVATAVF